jgi:hypothetical protein
MAIKPQIVSNPKRSSHHGVEAASQSWVAGDLVYSNAGAITICGDNPALVLGIAQADATGVTGAACHITPIYAEDIVAIDCCDSNGGVTIEDAASFTKGTAYPLKLDSGNWYVDLNGTTDRVFFEDHDVYGDLRDVLAGNTRYRGLVRFIDSVLQKHVGQ